MWDKKTKKKPKRLGDQLRPASTAPSAPGSLGIAKGDVVLIFSPNSLRFPICFLAVLSLGAIATTANPLYTVAELSKQAKDRRPKLVITVPQLWPKVAPLGLPAVILGPKDTPLSPSTHLPITYFSELIAAHASSDFAPPPIRQTDVAGLLYSSDTTGVSKGVILPELPIFPRDILCPNQPPPPWLLPISSPRIFPRLVSPTVRLDLEGPRVTAVFLDTEIFRSEVSCFSFSLS